MVLSLGDIYAILDHWPSHVDYVYFSHVFSFCKVVNKSPNLILSRYYLWSMIRLVELGLVLLLCTWRANRVMNEITRLSKENVGSITAKRKSALKDLNKKHHQFIGMLLVVGVTSIIQAILQGVQYPDLKWRWPESSPGVFNWIFHLAPIVANIIAFQWWNVPTKTSTHESPIASTTQRVIPHSLHVSMSDTGQLSTVDESSYVSPYYESRKHFSPSISPQRPLRHQLASDYSALRSIDRFLNMLSQGDPGLPSFENNSEDDLTVRTEALSPGLQEFAS